MGADLGYRAINCIPLLESIQVELKRLFSKLKNETKGITPTKKKTRRKRINLLFILY